MRESKRWPKHHVIQLKDKTTFEREKMIWKAKGKEKIPKRKLGSFGWFSSLINLKFIHLSSSIIYTFLFF